MGILMDSIDFNECLKKKKELEKEAEQTSPLAPDVSRKHAKKSNRVERVLYIDDGLAWNADCVGAFNKIYLTSLYHKGSCVKNSSGGMDPP